MSVKLDLKKLEELVGRELSKEEEISIRDKICKEIKEKVQNNTSMNIASEEVLEDNSILLTINL